MEGNVIYSNKVPKGLVIEFNGLLVVGTSESDDDIEVERKKPA